MIKIPYLLPGCERKKNYALLIDGDNTMVSCANSSVVLNWASDFGTLKVKQVYCAAGTLAWVEASQKHKMRRIQCAGISGKNDVDIAIALEVGRLSKNDNLDGFILVSGDGDFAQIATFINHHGFEVHGLGLQVCTSNDLPEFYDSYHYLASTPGGVVVRSEVLRPIAATTKYDHHHRDRGLQLQTQQPSTQDILNAPLQAAQGEVSGIPPELTEFLESTLTSAMAVGDVKPFGGKAGGDPLTTLVEVAVRRKNPDWQGYLKKRMKLVVARLKKFEVSAEKRHGKYWITRTC